METLSNTLLWANATQRHPHHERQPEQVPPENDNPGAGPGFIHGDSSCSVRGRREQLNQTLPQVGQPT
ncbi:hypothetical protein ACCAA_190029 [Candidatus Accumulibacter aalborgensis]|uniref:Uncharacterized protein n=1 Tax=Candidatus Accumulibacter aalborgensis TaxID=1860102 RepID=A0A1A8XLN5_9PROT|nr:hypothetical protein ACCAA_190029 [Candidatus Accumulibacter aalborgensis]